MLQQEKILNTLNKLLNQQPKIRKGTDAVYFCPKCHHAKRKLEISLTTGKYHCWVCGLSGMNLGTLLRKLNAPSEHYEILGEFKNHNNYDGVFLGKQGLDWHLEFTTSPKKVIHTFDEDDLIALYSKSKEEYDAVLESLALNNIPFIKAENPYWNLNGRLFLDPDGFRIVLVNLN